MECCKAAVALLCDLFLMQCLSQLLQLALPVRYTLLACLSHFQLLCSARAKLGAQLVDHRSVPLGTRPPSSWRDNGGSDQRRLRQALRGEDTPHIELSQHGGQPRHTDATSDPPTIQPTNQRVSHTETGRGEAVKR